MFTLSNAFFPYIGAPGLSVALDGGVVINNGSSTFIAAQTISLAANSTTYIFLNTSTITVQSNTSGFIASNCYPIAIVTTTTSSVTTIQDMRPDIQGGSGGGAGSVLWNQIGNAAGNLTLNNTNFTTTFNQTSAVNWIWANTTAATTTVPQNSPILNLDGTYWDWAGSASATDAWSIQDTLTAGKTFAITQSSEDAQSFARLTAPGHNFIKGEFITISGLTNLTWLNGLTLAIHDLVFATDDFFVLDPSNHGTQAGAAEAGTAVSFPAAQLYITHAGSSGLSNVFMPSALVGVQFASLSANAQDLLDSSSQQSTFRVFTNNPNEDGGAALFLNDVQDIAGTNTSGIISNLMLTPTQNIALGDGQAFGAAINCWHNGPFNYSSMIGVQIQVGSDPTGDIGGSATIAEMITLDVTPPFGPLSGGGVTTSTAIRLGDMTFPTLGTIGTSYAIFIPAQTIGNTSHYAIFEASSTCFNQFGESIFVGPITLQGSSSGSAKIQVAAAAGTPNALQLPTATGSSGQALLTNGANPQQLSWGVPTIPSGTVLWDQIGNAAGALTLANAGNATTFNQTSAVNWTWANTTAATNSVSQSSPVLNIKGTYWTGAASATDSWTIQDVVANGTNGTSTLTFTHAGSAGVAAVSLPLVTSPLFIGVAGAGFSVGTGNGNTFSTAAGSVVKIIAQSVSNNSWMFGVNASNGPIGAVASGGVLGWCGAGLPTGNPVTTGLSESPSGTLCIGTNNTSGDFTGTIKCKVALLTDTTTGTNLTLQNTTAATSSVSQSSPLMTINGKYWDGAASQTDAWTIQNVQTNGTNGASTLTFTHSGSSGTATLSVPNILLQTNAVSKITSSGGTGWMSFASNSVIQFANGSAVVLTLRQAAFGAASNAVYGWGDNPSDTGISRLAAASIAFGSGAANDTTANLSFNTVIKYGGTTTVAQGMPSEIALDDKTAQTAAITATSLTASAPRTGRYRVSFSATITTAGTTSVLGGTNGFQVIYTSPTDSVVKTTVPGNSVTSAANTTGTAIADTLTIYAKTGTAIQYQFDYTSTGTAMQYEIHVTLEAM